MGSAQIVKTSVANNSPSQDSNHPDDLFQSRYVTPGFKPFSHLLLNITCRIMNAKEVNLDDFMAKILF